LGVDDGFDTILSRPVDPSPFQVGLLIGEAMPRLTQSD
jgi:hypothetical protein